MSQKISIDQLPEALAEILKDYGTDVNTAVDKAGKTVMKDLVANTKKDAPVNPRSSEHYRDSIASKTLTSTTHKHSYLWYVKAPHYRLAHLLNNGHATRNGGRVPGDNHVTKNANKATLDYERKVKEAIEKGGS